MDLFKGKVIHSSQYRVPEKFIGQSVLIIGGGPSARDIILEIAAVGKMVSWVANQLFIFHENIQW